MILRYCAENMFEWVLVEVGYSTYTPYILILDESENVIPAGITFNIYIIQLTAGGRGWADARSRVLWVQSLGHEVVHNHTTMDRQKHVVQRSTVVNDLRHMGAFGDQITSLRHATVVEHLVL